MGTGCPFAYIGATELTIYREAAKYVLRLSLYTLYLKMHCT